MAATLSITASLLVGAFLVVAPWTAWWDANYLLQQYPAVRLVLLSPFARGGVTGLGLVNLVLAVQEARQHLGHDRD